MKVVRTSSGRVELRFKLSEPARVRVTLQRSARRGFRLEPGGFVVAGARGGNRVRLDRRPAFRQLRAGRYRWQLRATDMAGNVAPVARAGFAVRTDRRPARASG